MVAVKGTLDDVAYDVVLTGDASDPVQGSRRVKALVEAAARARWAVHVGPTGPVKVVDGGDVETVLALLAEETDLQSVTGGPAVAARPSGPTPIR